MATKITLKVEPRTITGRKVKTLRRQGILPLNLFGKKTTSFSAQANLDIFHKVYAQAGETNLIYVSVEGETKERPVLVSNLQHHPVTGAPLHADLHQVDLTEKATATVPVELVGTAPASDLGAVIVQMLNELEVEALPTDLPDKLEVDLSSLNQIGDSLAVKDLKIDTSKIEIKADPETQLVQAQEPQAEEEPAPTSEAEPEAAAPATETTEEAAA